MDNALYFGSENGGLYAVKTDDTLLWNYSAAGFVDSNPTVAIAAGVVYFGNHTGDVYGPGTLYALNALTGHTDWQHTIGPAIFSSPVVSGDMVIVGSEDDNLYAYYTGS